MSAAVSKLFPLCDLRMEKGLLHAINCNELITSVFDQLIEATKKVKAAAAPADKRKHGFRIDSFTKALDIIKAHPTPISSGTEALALKGIGKGISARIDEILETGSLQELVDIHEMLNVDIESRVVVDLCKITGIGEARAKALYKKGVRGIEDLLRKYKSGEIKISTNELTHHIAVGLDYYYDLLQRIPWAEVDQIRSIIKSEIEADPKMTVTVCGSYRRKRETCGDIDVLITHSDYTTETQVDLLTLNRVVKRLTDIGLLVGHLTENGKTKYMGVCKLSATGLGRRIDIRFVPTECYPAALLYFTGSGQFNRLMRYKANERGFTINEYGIFTYLSGVKGDRVPVTSEQEIFQIINCKYIEPELREF